MTLFLFQLLDWLINLYSFAFIARAILSWFRVDPYHPIVRFLIQITDPLVIPIRRYVPPMGGLDFAPMIALIILWFVRQMFQVMFAALI
ncbi:MAG TPA: YggT family protein [Chloroflexi bacterium]|nr:YggT family protein [Chloroflexota bacterium]